jgi:hypothetical protein
VSVVFEMVEVAEILFSGLLSSGLCGQSAAGNGSPSYPCELAADEHGLEESLV